MPDRPIAVLHLEEHMLPGLIEAYQQALDDLRPMLNDLSFRGRVPQPWTNDPVTEQLTVAFNHHLVDGPQSAYAALRLYEEELVRVLDTLTRMHADYLRTEQTTADDLAQL